MLNTPVLLITVHLKKVLVNLISVKGRELEKVLSKLFLSNYIENSKLLYQLLVQVVYDFFLKIVTIHTFLVTKVSIFPSKKSNKSFVYFFFLGV